MGFMDFIKSILTVTTPESRNETDQLSDYDEIQERVKNQFQGLEVSENQLQSSIAHYIDENSNSIRLHYEDLEKVGHYTEKLREEDFINVSRTGETVKYRFE